MDPVPPASPPPAPTPPPETCPLCGAPVPSGVRRCPDCNLRLHSQVDRRTLWRLTAGLAAVYAFVALVLVLTR